MKSNVCVGVLLKYLSACMEVLNQALGAAKEIDYGGVSSGRSSFG
jgi:hypothetical protein